MGLEIPIKVIDVWTEDMSLTSSDNALLCFALLCFALLAGSLFSLVCHLVATDSTWTSVFYSKCPSRAMGNTADKQWHLPFIGRFGQYHNTLCLFPQILNKHCFQFPLGLTVEPTNKMADEGEDGTCNQSKALSEKVSDLSPVHAKSITLTGIFLGPLSHFQG